jgi:hypothetical protein
MVPYHALTVGWLQWVRLDQMRACVTFQHLHLVKVLNVGRGWWLESVLNNADTARALLRVVAHDHGHHDGQRQQDHR